MLYTTYYDSPVGRLLLAEKEEALAGLWIESQKYYLGSAKEEAREEKETAVLSQARGWLDRYFRGERPSAGELPLAPSGSVFRQEVWKLLCEIPYGSLTTYKALAEQVAVRLGQASMSAQAVGNAVGHNPIGIIIPCHRVVGANGSLTGYAGGLDVKIRLLTLEGINLEKENLFLP